MLGVYDKAKEQAKPSVYTGWSFKPFLCTGTNSTLNIMHCVQNPIVTTHHCEFVSTQGVLDLFSKQRQVTFPFQFLGKVNRVTSLTHDSQITNTCYFNSVFDQLRKYPEPNHLPTMLRWSSPPYVVLSRLSSVHYFKQ